MVDPDYNDFKYHQTHAADCLCEEFNKLLKDAVLFITLGDLAWDTVRSHLEPSPVPWDYRDLRVGEPRARSNLTDVHGVLFGSMGKFVIPLMFPGGHTNALRNSYLEYLKEGLAALNYWHKKGIGE